MKRHRFILTTFLFTLTVIAIIKTNYFMKTDKGFKVNVGKARFGKHYKMKGVTLNTLILEISQNEIIKNLIQ